MERLYSGVTKTTASSVDRLKVRGQAVGPNHIIAVERQITERNLVILSGQAPAERVW